MSRLINKPERSKRGVSRREQIIGKPIGNALRDSAVEVRGGMQLHIDERKITILRIFFLDA
jgi:hypothetical protein